MTYQPNPIDTTQVELPAELNSLVEQLAESCHDQWARGRMAEGWRWGPERNDDDKEHPDLVPYRDLADSEKQYDRTTVVETLQAVVAMGHEVVPRLPGSGPHSTPRDCCRRFQRGHGDD